MLNAMHGVFCISGARVNCRTAEGMTPLHYATYGGHVDCVRLLLSAKADVHASTRYVFTGRSLPIAHVKQPISRAESLYPTNDTIILQPHAVSQLSLNRGSMTAKQRVALMMAWPSL